MFANTSQQIPWIVLTSPLTAVLQSYDSIILMSQQRCDVPCGWQSLTLSLRLPQLSTTKTPPQQTQALCTSRVQGKKAIFEEDFAR